MAGIGSQRLAQLREEFGRVERILESTPAIDKSFGISTEEFVRRQRRVSEALAARGFEAGFVFSDEHYDGDVPYLRAPNGVFTIDVASLTLLLPTRETSGNGIVAANGAPIPPGAGSVMCDASAVAP